MQTGPRFKTVLNKTTSILIKPLLVFVLLIAGLVAFHFSWQRFAYDEHLDGPYHLTAMDFLEEMSLDYDLSGGFKGRIGPTVFAAGWNEDYIVVKEHPLGKAYTVNRSVTHYHYLIRALDHDLAEPDVSVRGPFNEAEFMKEKERLNLPDFSKEIEALK